MKTLSNEIMLKLFKYMYIVVFFTTIIAMYLYFDKAFYPLGILVLSFLGSEIHVRNFYKGKPMIAYGCSWIESENDDKARTDLISHLLTILVCFVLFISMHIYLFIES